MLASVALTVAAASAPSYPASEVLGEQQKVCSVDYRYTKRAGHTGSISETIDNWMTVADASGWSVISSEMQGLSRNDIAALGTIESLNHALFGSFAQANRYTVPAIPMLGRRIYSKNVAGRRLYLSVHGSEGSVGRFAECRVHDLLGDGIVKNPISRAIVESASQTKVQISQGAFGSKQYNWSHQRGQLGNVRVHFGFDGWKLSPFSHSRRMENFDPYAPYGLTLVTSIIEQEIIL